VGPGQGGWCARTPDKHRMPERTAPEQLTGASDHEIRKALAKLRVMPGVPYHQDGWPVPVLTGRAGDRMPSPVSAGSAPRGWRIHQYRSQQAFPGTPRTQVIAATSPTAEAATSRHHEVKSGATFAGQPAQGRP
jgi:hypothetical protein